MKWSRGAAGLDAAPFGLLERSRSRARNSLRRRLPKKGWNEFDVLVECAASAKRAAQSSRDACAQIGFRTRAGDVHAAVDEAVDEGADDLGAVQHLAALPANLAREPIEMKDLPVEEHDRHL
jgi:hypothetical protein